MSSGVVSLLGPTEPPAGALRILARREDTEVLIVHGNDRHADLDAGERLAKVVWFPSIEVAAVAARFCSEQLERPFPHTDGWHPFAVEHLDNLLALARTHLNVTDFAPEPMVVVRSEGQATRQGERLPWSGARAARLGYLASLGYTAKAIGADPLVRATEKNVHKYASRFGIPLTGSSSALIPVRLSVARRNELDTLGARRGFTREGMARFLVEDGLTRETRAAASGQQPDFIPFAGLSPLPKTAA